MQLIRPTVWGPGLVTSLKGAGSTQPLSSFWSQQNFEQFLAATKFLSLLWPVGLCCWLQPPHVTSSSPAVAVKFLLPLLTRLGCYLLILFPSSITSLCPPHYWALDFFNSNSCKKPSKKGPFSGSHGRFSAAGRCAPPARQLSSGERRAAQLL